MSVSGYSGFSGTSGASGFSGVLSSSSGNAIWGTAQSLTGTVVTSQGSYPVANSPGFYTASYNSLSIGRLVCQLPQALQLYNAGIVTKEEIRDAVAKGMEDGTFLVEQYLPELVFNEIWTQDEAREQIGLEILE